MAETKIPKLHKVSPILIKKNALKINTSRGNYDFLLRCVKNAPHLLIKEDEIYRSTGDDFLKGKYPNLVLVNKLNVLSNTSQTIATYVENSVSVRLTSDAIVKVIGQTNYDTVFGALCSIISLETRVQGILSLLSSCKVKETSSTASQTVESSRDVFMKRKTQRNKRKKVSPYVITDHLMETSSNEDVAKKIDVIEDTDIKIECRNLSKTVENSDNNPEFPELKHIVNEDSNISDISLGNLSLNSGHIPSIVDNTNRLLNYIEHHTTQVSHRMIRLMDGTELLLPGNPDNLHLATPEILKDLSPVQRGKLLWHQAFIDFKMCLERDEDDNLPLHWAVLNNDVDLLRRQCVVLTSHQHSLDIPAGNMTALQMALADSSHKCTEMLLRYGADVLLTDDEAKTALHLAAERDEHHTNAVLEHCRTRARFILKENEDLWEDDFDEKPDEVLAEYLVNKISVLCDEQGYTPLMLASKAGNHACVNRLVRAAPYTVNMAMPTCGNTALYLAVTEACGEAMNSENKSKINEKFMKTIECLVENGADPSIVNSYGSSVNDLLNEFNFHELSMLIANKLTSIKYLGGRKLEDFSSYMLLKNNSGGFDLTHVRESVKVYKKPEKKYPVKPVDCENKETGHEQLARADSEPTPAENAAYIKFNRPKPMKSNSRIDAKDREVLEPRKRAKTTIYKTLPVVKVVSYQSSANKGLVLLKDNLVEGGRSNVVLNKQFSLPIKILPKSNKQIKIGPVKRNTQQQNSVPSKRSKNTGGKKT
ncbi:putative B-cell lymphoma 3-encoded protein [Danaus plexippus plexippus]|uniref:B-cell lymphoma 3-encoded protein n=1 Tax=Danaus plexippus plexippus TaxID=278856 RepID=A0A212ELI6_DANPL|nr:putative B-cell lymphoma 3-encoded protein [Danaus plexippus plexippus]